MAKAPHIRLAENKDGRVIRGLVEKQFGVLEQLDWDDIAPYWLVAERDGRIVGAIQTCPSRPVGRLEMLTVDRTLGHREKALVIKALAYAGMGLLKGHRSAQVQMFIPEDLSEYRAVLEKRGAVILDTGHMLAKRLI